MREGHVLFLPQRPYMSLGTLREQLLYPNPKVAADDAYLHEARLEGERAPEKDPSRQLMAN